MDTFQAKAVLRRGEQVIPLRGGAHLMGRATKSSWRIEAAQVQDVLEADVASKSVSGRVLEA